jgi:hypothetical protein
MNRPVSTACEAIDARGDDLRRNNSKGIASFSPEGCFGIMEIVADNVRAGATTFPGFVSG